MTSLFFHTHEDRVALARRQYFEEGKLPTGAISDAVLQSWGNCMRSKRACSEKVEFQPVSTSRSHLALLKNAELCEAWRHELKSLETIIGATGCDAVLTDTTGVLIGVAGAIGQQGRVLKAAHRIGVNLSEDLVGTTAPGLVLRTGKLALVRGSEHYFEQVSHMHCAAAPIRDIRGRLIAVLDISSEGNPFRFDVSAVLGYFASAIENRLVVAQADQHVIVRFQISEALLDTPLSGMVGIGLDGTVDWHNATAARLLGFPSGQAPHLRLTAEQVFDRTVPELLSMQGPVNLLQCPNGLSVYVRSEFHARDGVQSLVPVEVLRSVKTTATSFSDEVTSRRSGVEAELADVFKPNPEELTTTTTTLRAADADLIVRTLAEHKGNVSAVARKLKVSRGLVYRHMKRQQRQSAC